MFATSVVPPSEFLAPFWPIYHVCSEFLEALFQLPVVVAIGLVTAVLWSFTRLPVLPAHKNDLSEPPFLAPEIPIIGHIWGIFTQGSNYFRKLE